MSVFRIVHAARSVPLALALLATSPIAAQPAAIRRWTPPRAEHATTAAPPTDATDGSTSGEPTPATTYATRRFRASIDLRTGIIGMPRLKLGFVGTGLAVRFGAPLSDAASLTWETSLVAGYNPDSSGDDQLDEDVALPPATVVQLTIGPVVRRAVARRYFDVGVTMTSQWVLLDYLVPMYLAGGVRFGAGAFLLRSSGGHAQTIGGELRIEKGGGGIGPMVTALVAWDAAF